MTLSNEKRQVNSELGAANTQYKKFEVSTERSRPSDLHNFEPLKVNCRREGWKMVATLCNELLLQFTWCQRINCIYASFYLPLNGLNEFITIRNFYFCSNFVYYISQNICLYSAIRHLSFPTSCDIRQKFMVRK